MKSQIRLIRDPVEKLFVLEFDDHENLIRHQLTVNVVEIDREGKILDRKCVGMVDSEDVKRVAKSL